MTTSNPRALAACAALATLTLAGTVRADSVNCTVVELSMTKGKDAVMPDEVKHFAKKLGKPPFSSWNVFKVLSSDTFTLTTPKAASHALKLAQGSSTVVLHDVDTDPGKKARVTLGIKMTGASGKQIVDTKVTADAGDYLDYGELIPPSNDGHFVFLSCTP
jgi:hypothetical protein